MNEKTREPTNIHQMIAQYRTIYRQCILLYIRRTRNASTLITKSRRHPLAFCWISRRNLDKRPVGASVKYWTGVTVGRTRLPLQSYLRYLHKGGGSQIVRSVVLLLQIFRFSSLNRDKLLQLRRKGCKRIGFTNPWIKENNRAATSSHQGVL